ncbi:DUF695 domain-containing protein [Pontibacter sp. G13]|uniref:DUF695 domain-containing protein n=1 Tax=Pontibacter sp. G13 TaxID=3074898 RepID=UPI00288C4309|nr:DUF695 domain-containing protein [Pontibacter sp. G13]WNJ17191.1 DUF695 domain-containing protein [Pontibacter sp. G13]
MKLPLKIGLKQILWKLFQNGGMSREEKVVIPDFSFKTFHFVSENKEGVAIINKGLLDIFGSEVFVWNLSVMFHYRNHTDKGIPEGEDLERVSKYIKSLDYRMNPDSKKPNALFLGYLIWNDTTEAIWRVYQATEVNKLLVEELKVKDYPEPFDYRIDPDKSWELCSWHLKAVK